MNSFPSRNLPARFERALAEVAHRLGSAPVPVPETEWALGGSLMLVARGLAIEARDLDIFADAETARRMAAYLGDLVSQTSGPDAPGAPTSYASAFFASLEVHGVSADLVGGFARRHESGVYRLAVAADSVDAWLQGDGWRVQLLRAEEWLLFYWLKPKGDGREALLEDFLLQGRLDRKYLEKVLAQRQLPPAVRQTAERFLARASRGRQE